MESDEIYINYKYGCYKEELIGVKSIKIVNDIGEEITIPLEVLRAAFSCDGIGSCIKIDTSKIKFPSCFTSKCIGCEHRRYCGNAKV
jgi:hypothetical protein